MSSTAVAQRRSAIPIRSSRNTHTPRSSPDSAPLENTVREYSHAGQALSTFSDLQDAGVSGGFFLNTNAPVYNSFFNEAGPSVRQPPVDHGNVSMRSNGNVPFTHDYTPTTDIPRPSQNAEYDIYYHHLLGKGRGTPLWEPGPQMMFPFEYRRNGVSIGDVGILYRTGDFAFLFNIFLPADHDINRGRVPDGFVPLAKSAKVKESIKKSVVYDRGNCIANSESLRRTSADFTFQTTGRDGAVLVLPEGALTEDLRKYKLVEKYIADNAKSWYDYVESDDCGTQTENGDIRVVIGTDKASCWGMATFEHINVEDPLHFGLKEDGSGSHSRAYKWDGIMAGRAGPPEEEMRDLLQEPNTAPIRNQCVFVRTLNISVSGKVHNELAVHEVRASSSFKDCVPDFGQRQARSVNLEAVSHPSNLLNKCLLEKCPNAKVVITKDSDWISVITENDTIIPSFEVICARVLASHTICEKEGVITLRKRKIISNSGSDRPAVAITTHPRRTSRDTLMMGDDRGAYGIIGLIGRLFLRAPDDQALTDGGIPHAYIIIDALDECPDRKPPDTLGNSNMEEHRFDKEPQIDIYGSLPLSRDRLNSSKGGDGEGDIYLVNGLWKRPDISLCWERRQQYRGTITDIGNQTNYPTPSNSIEELRKRSFFSAFDSAARFDPPRCADSTRLGIVQIEEWLNSVSEKPSSFSWLSGPAGTGKTAIAQSLMLGNVHRRRIHSLPPSLPLPVAASFSVSLSLASPSVSTWEAEDVANGLLLAIVEGLNCTGFSSQDYILSLTSKSHKTGYDSYDSNFYSKPHLPSGVGRGREPHDRLDDVYSLLFGPSVLLWPDIETLTQAMGTVIAHDGCWNHVTPMLDSNGLLRAVFHDLLRNWTRERSWEIWRVGQQRTGAVTVESSAIGCDPGALWLIPEFRTWIALPVTHAIINGAAFSFEISRRPSKPNNRDSDCGQIHLADNPLQSPGSIRFFVIPYFSWRITEVREKSMPLQKIEFD